MRSRPDPEPGSTAESAPTGVPAALWGWVRLLVGAAAQACLVLMASLAAIALIPSLFGWHGTVIETGSMEPHIDAGDVVVLADLPAEQPVPVGGVVQFTSPATAQPDGIERSVLHRIVTDHEDGTYATAGDANADVDSTALVRARITGQARLLVPFIGLPALWLGGGQHLLLGLWAATTAAALLCAVVVFVPSPRADEPDDEPDDVHDTEEIPVLARRSALAVAGTAVLAGLTARPVPSSTAAFTARTGTRASWAVATPPPAPTLGRAAPYGLLAAASVVNHTPGGHDATVGADVGTHPGTNIEGLQNSGSRPNVTGSVEAGTPAAAAAMADAHALESDLSARHTTASHSATLTGRITPGVHISTTGPFTVSSTVTLDAQGDPSALFVFRATTLTTAQNSQIILAGGTKAANVYWVAAGTIVLGAGTTARGTYLARGNIAANLNAGGPANRLALEGRLISLGTASPGGAIDLNRPTITLPA